MGCNNSKSNSSSSSGSSRNNKLNVHGHGEVVEQKVTYKILLLGKCVDVADHHQLCNNNNNNIIGMTIILD